MNYLKNIRFFLAVLFIPTFSVAQNETNIDSIIGSAKKVKGWQPGYVVKTIGRDTVYGLVKKHASLGTPVEWIDFKPNEKAKKKLYRNDSIIGFKYANIIYNYYDYCGWSKLILKGVIDVYTGYTYQYIANGTISRSSCLALKKRNQLVFIGADDTIILSGILKQKTKNLFRGYIADNLHLLAELEKEGFRYKELEDLVRRYNEWAEINNK